METRDIKLTDISADHRAREAMGDLDGLAASIRDKGVLQPITVAPGERSDAAPYRLIAGGRRLAASEIAELPTIPAVIRASEGALDDLEVELIENIHRKDLEWQERCSLELRIYEIGKSHGKSMRAIAEETGTPKSTASRYIVMANAMEQFPELRFQPNMQSAEKLINQMHEVAVVRELKKRAEVVTAAVHEEALEELHETYQETEMPEDAPPLADIIFTIANKSYQVGDALEELSSIESNSIDFVEMDPPYAIDLHTKKRDSAGGKASTDSYLEWTPKQFIENMERLAGHFYRVLKPNTFCVVWFAFDYMQVIRIAFGNAGFKTRAVPGIWDKGEQGQTKQPDEVLASCYEPFMYMAKGRPILGKKGRGNMFRYKPIPSAQKIHPTERPIELYKELLEVYAQPGAKVLCPFLGSGAMINAALSTERQCVGWDLSEDNKNKFLIKIREEWENA